MNIFLNFDAGRRVLPMGEGGAICSFSAILMMEAWHNLPFYKPLFLYKKPFNSLLWYKTVSTVVVHPPVYNLVYFIIEKEDCIV